ncbi:protein FAM200A-like [Oratosquilla oratoria]|uniref:protein FAM200A-like n=1 Tax=Oratosquilla oratoria TaxID=337810 RepID=UPI003F76570C
MARSAPSVEAHCRISVLHLGRTMQPLYIAIDASSLAQDQTEDQYVVTVNSDWGTPNSEAGSEDSRAVTLFTGATTAHITRLFKELCKHMNTDHDVLFYTVVRWLSKGNNVNNVFGMEDKIKLFLEVQEKRDHVAQFEDEAWNKRVAYLADIFEQLNKLNLKLHGRERHILLFQDSLWAFVSKLENWRRKTNLGNIAMFEKLCAVMDESRIQLDQFLKEEMTKHLQSPEKEFEQYFSELTEEILVTNLFSIALNISSIPDEIQDKFLDL